MQPARNAAGEGVVEDAARREFRDGMARLAAAVNIVTTDGPAGRAGFTASAVCSVSDSPPSLLVCLNRSASVYRTFKANQVLCVNTLAHGQEDLALLFGGRTPMEERFAAASWSSLETGAPALAGALATFDCRITEIVESGTHDVMFCEVLAVGLGESLPGLIYFARRFHGVAIPG
ncbi:flavin reductase [Labrys monachus]|nr:flavin reductase [Labrys monachus]